MTRAQPGVLADAEARSHEGQFATTAPSSARARLVGRGAAGCAAGPTKAARVTDTWGYY